MSKLVTIGFFQFALYLFLMGMHTTCKAQEKKNYRKVPVVDVAVGYASFYSDKFIGKITANGEKFSQDLFTCAHNTHPFGTRLLVTNLSNQQSIEVRVNDRLHHRNPRLVDLTSTGAKKLGFYRSGITKVRVEVIKRDSLNSNPKID